MAGCMADDHMVYIVLPACDISNISSQEALVELPSLLSPLSHPPSHLPLVRTIILK